MNTTSILFAAAISAVVNIVPATAASTWSIDPTQSSIDFSLKFITLGKSTGAFTKMSGAVIYDGKSLENAKVDANVDVASINTKSAKRDDHLRTKDFFDVGKFPVATFKSSRVTAGKNGAFEIDGTLTLHGISKNVVLDATRQSESSDDMVAIASTTINRKDFGIDYGLNALLGNKVNLRLKIHLIRAGAEKTSYSAPATKRLN